MKTKTVNVSVSIKGDEISVVKHILERISDEEEEVFDICVENIESNEMKAYYLLGNLEANGIFIDKDVCEDYQKVLLYALGKRKIYNCKGKVIDCEIDTEEWIAYFVLEVPLLLSEYDGIEEQIENQQDKFENEEYDEVPELPYAAQEFNPEPTEPGKQKYDIKIVGIRHQTTDKEYEELVTLSKNRGEVILRAEEENEQDPLAVAVYLQSGEKVGYVASQYLAVVQPEVKKNSELTAIVTYMEYQGATATAVMEFESDISIMAVHLFSRYTPIEVYRANYLYAKWGGILEKEEEDLMSNFDQTICFDRFFELSLFYQNRIASKWDDRMHKATVENPTNRGGKMSVPLDLSIYGTSWSELDIANRSLINKIEKDNKAMAVYIRFRRTNQMEGLRMKPEDFMETNLSDLAGEELLIRMNEVFEKNML